MPTGRRATPTVRRHLELASENLVAFQVLSKTKAPTWHWAGTALFYSAVHYADAFLQAKGEPAAGNHDERWRQLNRHVDDEFIQHYGALKDLSEDWRYYGTERDAKYVEMARAGHHKPIEKAATAAVKEKASLEDQDR